MVRRQVWPRPPLPLPYWLLPRTMSPQIPSFLGAQETPSQTYLPSPLAYGWKQITPVHALTCRLLPRRVNCPFSTEGASVIIARIECYGMSVPPDVFFTPLSRRSIAILPKNAPKQTHPA